MSDHEAYHRERTSDGKYTYSDLDRMCVCGHTLGFHTAARVKVEGKFQQPCIGPLYKYECDCQCFRPTRKKEPKP